GRLGGRPVVARRVCLFRSRFRSRAAPVARTSIRPDFLRGRAHELPLAGLHERRSRERAARRRRNRGRPPIGVNRYLYRSFSPCGGVGASSGFTDRDGSRSGSCWRSLSPSVEKPRACSLSGSGCPGGVVNQTLATSHSGGSPSAIGPTSGVALSFGKKPSNRPSYRRS